MKVRENELHEPKKVVVKELHGDNVWYRPLKICAVCGFQMLEENDYNYCPKCGARLKESSNGEV